MEKNSINWAEVPEVITKEQLWKLCHISKNTARILLQSGKIPCIYSGGQTRCYKILKKDVIKYLARRDTSPEYYAISKEENGSNNRRCSSITVPEEDMHQYYTFLLRNFPDVMDSKMISDITGYGTTAINNWCKQNLIQHFKIAGRNMIPKVYLVDFFCSNYFRTIARKTEWHKKTLTAYLNRKRRKNRRK